MRALSALLLALLLTTPAQGDTLVVPNGFENVDASGPGFVFPFATSLISNYPLRFQQVYEASSFPDLDDVLTISELRFRINSPDGDRDPFTVEQVEVHLSTTAVAPDALTNGSTQALDDNVGADDTIVFTGGLSWDPCGSDPCLAPPAPFDLAVVFATPFSYDPTAGNLLLEVFNGSEEYPIQIFDALGVTGDAISNAREVLSRSDLTTHLFPSDSFGLITQFVYTVPEPGSTGAALVALLGMAALVRARA